MGVAGVVSAIRATSGSLSRDRRPACRRGADRRREVSLIAPAQLGAGLPDRVLERVGEGRCRGRDDVRVAAHRRPGPGAILRIDDDPGPRGRRGVAVEDAHLVVDEVDVVDGRIERPERLAQRGVERVDRAVAVGGRVQHLAVDRDLDRRLGEELAPVALLDETRVVDDPERRRVVGRVATDEQLERGLGALEREAVGLELLDQLRQLARIDALEVVPELVGSDRRVRPAAELRDDQPPGVARPRPARRAGTTARPWPRPPRGRRPCARTPTARRTAGSRSA